MEFLMPPADRLTTCRYNGILRVMTFLVRPKERTEAELNGEKAERIARYVFARLGIDEKNMRRRIRKEELVNAKRISIYLLIEHTKLARQKIGPMFGLDRTSAPYHHSRCIELMDVDKKFRALVTSIEVGLNLRKEGEK